MSCHSCTHGILITTLILVTAFNSHSHCIIIADFSVLYFPIAAISQLFAEYRYLKPVGSCARCLTSQVPIRAEVDNATTQKLSLS